MYYTGNPINDFDRYDAYQARRLSQLPVCADCGESIQQETAVYINEVWLCDDCLDAYRREVSE